LVPSFKDKSLISVAEPKECKGLIKSGIHINFPGLVVSQNEALQLMYHIIHSLGIMYPARDWSQVIDSSVYGTIGKQGSGFRMPWCYKKIKGLVEGYYLPIYFYNPIGGEIIEIGDPQTPTVEKFMMATIRTDKTDVVSVPEFEFICQPVKKERASKKEGDFTASEMKNEISNYELAQSLQNDIRKMEGQEKVYVQKIFEFKTRYLVKTNSKYCENIKREHGSNHIKLVIEGGTIHQECFCRCETLDGRKGNQFCKDFRGKKYNLSSKTLNLLGPKKKKCMFNSTTQKIDQGPSTAADLLLRI
jgi:hypothetical protein